MVGHEGKSEWVIGTMHDVTDAWRLEEARNDFVSLASHQLRTPATVVKQYLHVLDGMAGRLTPEQQTLAQKALTGMSGNCASLTTLCGSCNLNQVD
ncbi:hypothetical protein IPG36_04890 [bacterium]|nr:MAG: hypothetical protein IPG36_04890 [bacterium]